MENGVLDLEVDVDGEEIFAVSRKVMCRYSGRIAKLLSRSQDSQTRLKVIFNEFPGGSDCFEQILRFCYNQGTVDLNPLNVSAISCAAYFMEMNHLYEKTVTFLEEMIHYWSWLELVLALKHCQSFVSMAVSTGTIDKLLDSVVSRVALAFETSPCSPFSSSDTTGFRSSCDTRASGRSRSSCLQGRWWFDDIAILEPDLIRILVKLMESRNMDNEILGQFLFHYHKSRASSSLKERTKAVETVVDMLDLLDTSCVSYKSLFRILSDASNLKINQKCRSKLLHMIGLQLDRATLDSLLVPSPHRASYSYDVDLVLRLLQSFLCGGASTIPSNRIKKVASLIDLYLVEVAPDPYLQPSQFAALIRALPDSARASFDRLHDSVNLYLETHSELSYEQKMSICSGLKTVRCFSQKGKMSSCFRGIEDPHSVSRHDFCGDGRNLRARLRGMEWRAVELEMICRELQVQMNKMVKGSDILDQFSLDIY